MKVQKINEYYKEEKKDDYSFVINEGIFDKRESTYKEKVFSELIHLMMDDQGISEKSFDEVDRLMDKLRVFFKDNEHLDNVLKEFEEESRRVSFCAEFVYDAMIKNG